MRKLAFICILFLGLVSNVFCIEKPLSPNMNRKDPWFAMDKLKHFSSSLYLTTTSYYIQNKMFSESNKKSKINSVSITVTCALGKEIWDSRKKNGFFSIKDLIADCTGIAIGLIFINNIQ
ncbi:MAG: DUF2279 domain-containing protein [Candidatus Marinimicrobia bacterium]|nr:DUF2279 domain-containing protein [Candidatus Neomarinimicrobiota bacterium]MCK4447851.1 DUF2279 domain-containing protein [Candidatus Neomarinimicrobiota bacterium]